MRAYSKLEESKLDNPVFHSLQESHKEFCVGYQSILFYDPLCCPFGGLSGTTEQEIEMERYTGLTRDFFIVGNKPQVGYNHRLETELICLQMVCYDQIDLAPIERIVRLNDEHEQELLSLVNLVQPGYFNKRTSKLGAYFGIFRDGKLASVTGERMKTNRFTEISAVVTHPDHTGKGYAKQLVAYAVNEVFRQDKIPYLHVAQTNEVAIRLYEKLGLRVRRKMSFWHYVGL